MISDWLMGAVQKRGGEVSRENVAKGERDQGRSPEKAARFVIRPSNRPLICVTSGEIEVRGSRYTIYEPIMITVLISYLWLFGCSQGSPLSIRDRECRRFVN